MKKTLALLLCVSLSACSANSVLQNLPVVGNVCSAASGTLIDEKVVYGAEALFNVPAQAYVVADKNGKLTPELKAKLKPLLIQMDDYRLAIVAAKGTINCDYDKMKELHIRVIQLLPR